jgi:putative ABC transport system permease protein
MLDDNKSMTHRPPILAQKLLSRFLKDELAEEVLGDLDEKFYRTVKGKSAWKAKVNYWYQTINYLRPFAIRNFNPNLFDNSMYKSYFKIGWRNLLGQKMYSFIKIGGFALGIAACLLIALFIRDELSYDRHYVHADRIYRVVGVLEGEPQKSVHFPPPLANAIKEDYPEVQSVGRYVASELFGAGKNEVRRADQVENAYDEGFTYFDQSLLNMLEMPMVYGSREHALSEPNSIVITRRKAEKYFPNEDPVGKLLIINNDEARPYKIGGVVENFSPTSHLQFDFLVTLTAREFWPGEQTTWKSSNYPTYVLLRPGVDAQQLAKKMTTGTIEKYFLPSMLEDGQVDAREIVNKAHLELQPLTEIYLGSNVSDGLAHSDIRFIWLFGSIAAFILILACINFINLATARSANRAKEVGLRKVVGSLRTHIIHQFLAESLIYSVCAFVLGLLLAWMFLPYFNQLSSKVLVFPWNEWWLSPILLSGAVCIGVLAGIYPSFYLSSFKPIQVLKGNLSLGSKNGRTRSLLVVFQFTTSIVLIAGTLIIYRQMDFILNTKVGFDKDQVVVVQGANTLGDKVRVFKEELLKLPGVKRATISDYLPISGTKRNGNTFWKQGRIKEEKGVGGQIWRVDHDYVKTMGMTVVDGRDFMADAATDSQAVVINETMARELGLAEPVGKVITNGVDYTVIGVVEDFHFETMKENIEPLCLILGNSPDLVSVKVDGSDPRRVIESISTTWKSFAPHQPVRFSFLDESFAQMYDDVERTGRIFTSFAILAIIVACLGLFALSAFMVEQRSKEISIRLVLGATVNNIFSLLTMNFLKLVLISLIIAVPVSWVIMQEWLKDFVYKIDLTWDIFAIAGVVATLIAILTISYQSLSAAFMNPTSNLKSQ